MIQRYFCAAAFIGLLGAVVGAGPAQTEVPVTQPATQPAAALRLPGTVFGFLREVDGTLVCTTSKGVYVAVENPQHWSDVSLTIAKVPSTGIVRPVGGDIKCAYVTVEDKDAVCSLTALPAGKEAYVVRKNSSRLATFASSLLGVVSTGSNVSVTADGGTTWHPTVPLLAKQEQISALTWATKSQLLIGGADGSVQLMDCKGADQINRIWNTSIVGAVSGFALDGEHVWVRDGTLSRLKLTDGHVDAVIKPDLAVEGAAVCHEDVLAWDAEFISVWAQKAEQKDYVHIGRIPCVGTMAILPLKAPQCAVFTSDGRGFVLDPQQLRISDLELAVSLAPSPALLNDPTRASPAQLQMMLELAKTVPPAQRFAIFREGNTKLDLTPRQRVEWTIDQFRQAVATQPAATQK